MWWLGCQAARMKESPTKCFQAADQIGQIMWSHLSSEHGERDACSLETVYDFAFIFFSISYERNVSLLWVFPPLVLFWSIISHYLEMCKHITDGWALVCHPRVLMKTCKAWLFSPAWFWPGYFYILLALYAILNQPGLATFYYFRYQICHLQLFPKFRRWSLFTLPHSCTFCPRMEYLRLSL